MGSAPPRAGRVGDTGRPGFAPPRFADPGREQAAPADRGLDGVRSPNAGTSGSRSLSVEDVPGGLRSAYEVKSRGRYYRSNGRASQTFAVWSVLPVTTRDPSRLNDAD